MKPYPPIWPGDTFLSSHSDTFPMGWAPERASIRAHTRVGSTRAWYLLWPEAFIACGFLLLLPWPLRRLVMGILRRSAESEHVRYAAIGHIYRWSFSQNLSLFPLACPLFSTMRRNTVNLPWPGRVQALLSERAGFIHPSSAPSWLVFNKKIPHTISNFG